MTGETIVMLLAAGLLGGIANAMAGGATLITFPAMMAAGLPPIQANASNTTAVVFGNIVAAWTDRKQLPALSFALVLSLLAGLAGGACGAWLLLNTPEKLFTALVPALIGGATLVFAFGKPLQNWVARTFGVDQRDSLQTVLVFPAGIYGGYFGAGLGVVLMAILGVTSAQSLRATNALKNVLSVMANVSAIAFFAIQGVIQWPQTLVMMAACITGGYVGAKAVAIISPASMRIAVVAIGVAMTLVYAWRYWV
jgi:uncharacterized protein